jgi:phosphatidate cytidylyltransferase
MASELGKRVAVAVVGIPIGLLILYRGGIALGVLLAVIAAGAAWELYRMAGQKGTSPFTIAGCIIAAVFVLMATAVPSPSEAAPRIMLVLIASLLILSTAAIWRRGVAGNPLNTVAVTLFGALLTGGTLTYAIFLREMARVPSGIPGGISIDASTSATGAYTRTLSLLAPDSPWIGPALVGFPLILTWISDTFAYFGGRMWGDRKLIPSVSPGKTIAGAVSGVIGTTVIGAVYSYVAFRQLDIPISLVQGAIGGALISVVAQVGDLSESLLKREAGVKDSGALLPGHGGIYDRFDSLLFVFPVAYWYISSLILSR